ncbi:hypothetical protein [Microbacterium telephonicum]|uniref:Uncharacterized protein n=1 Tax=Microbacterium telephonicum TaxID=1714841 RepID=A0A498CL00_9MICO|nr:hypothetical protein [Microbacterium telephonicum]RLK52638.1 hypothetical protein C7474_0591 [Microbacterium telephonicum]
MSDVLDDEDREEEDRTVPGLLVEELDGGWRLCDDGVAGGDAAHVIAYVESIAAGFDVVWCTGPRRRQQFSRWTAVMDAAARHVGGHRSSGATAPVRIPHQPPARG